MAKNLSAFSRKTEAYSHFAHFERAYYSMLAESVRKLITWFRQILSVTEHFQRLIAWLWWFAAFGGLVSEQLEAVPGSYSL